MQKTIAVKAHFQSYPGRKRRKWMPAYERTITVPDPEERTLPEPQPRVVPVVPSSVINPQSNMHGLYNVPLVINPEQSNRLFELFKKRQDPRLL